MQSLSLFPLGIFNYAGIDFSSSSYLKTLYNVL